MRVGFIYGDGDQHLTEFIPIKKMGTRNHDGIGSPQRRDAGLSLAATVADIPGGIFNVADDLRLEVKEILAQVDPKIVQYPTDLIHFPPYEMDISTEKIKQTLRFTPVYPSYYDAKNSGGL